MLLNIQRRIVFLASFCKLHRINNKVYFTEYFWHGLSWDLDDRERKAFISRRAQGGRYRDTLVPFLIKNYDIEVGGEDGKQSFDQVRSFRRFLLFARDTMQWHRPMAPDIHWSSIADHLSTLVVNGGRFDSIFWVERFDNGMQQVLDRVKTTHPVDVADVPRFNQSQVHGPKRAHPVADYFDDLSMHLMYEMYRRDFYLFKYDYFDPSNVMPMAEMDLDEIHAELTK